MAFHWKENVKLTGEEIIQIFNKFEDLNNYSNRFEDYVEEVIKSQFPQEITLEDKMTYIGCLSSIIWIDRNEYKINPPRLIAIHKKSNGCFKSKILK